MAIKRIKRIADDFFKFIDDIGNPINIGGKEEFRLEYSKTENETQAGDPFNEDWSDEVQDGALEQNLLNQVLTQASWNENVPLQQWEYDLVNASVKAIHNATVQQTRVSQLIETVTFLPGSTVDGTITIVVAAEPTVDINVDIFLKESEAL